MALADVKAYFKQVEQMRQDAKSDLEDFEQGLKDGYVTEDRVAEIRDEFAKIDTNYQRLLYIMWLFDIPNRRAKKVKFNKANQDLIARFSLAKSDAEAVQLENSDALAKLRQEIKLLKKNK